jgi:cell division protein FtsW
MRKTKLTARRPDLVMLGMVLALLIFGTIVVYDASVVVATKSIGDKFYFVKWQLMWAAIGLFFLYITMRIDYHRYLRIALPLLITTLVAMGLVFAPVIGYASLSGAHRWLSFHFFQVQPAEVAKLTLAIFLAAWFDNKQDLKTWGRGLLPVIVLVAVLSVLLLLQRDLGSLLILIGMILAVYFVAGARLIHYLISVPVGILALMGIILSSTYRRARLLTFLDPTADPQGNGYHIGQILLALGSGGILGTGLGQSRGKFDYIPEVQTDSIFAVIGEELGFVGSIVLFALFGYLIYRGFSIVKNAPDRSGQLLALGIMSSLGIQIVLNLASMVSLFPLTGIPLPFISYGGSSLVVSLASVGILLNISRFQDSKSRH